MDNDRRTGIDRGERPLPVGVVFVPCPVCAYPQDLARVREQMRVCAGCTSLFLDPCPN